MDPLTMGMIGGGMNLLGSFFSADTSAKNTQATLQFNAQQAELNRDFQERMSNTAYQRASADMKAAGLNPMMMFGSGGAASSPGGAQASGTVNNQSPFAHLGEAADKFVSSAINAKTFEKMTDEIANLKATQDLITSQTGYTKVQTGVAHEETEKRHAEAELSKLQLPGARFSAKQSEDLLSMPDKLRRAAEVAKYGSGAAGDILAPLINSARGARSLFSDRFYFH